jgi:hypothetical protein
MKEEVGIYIQFRFCSERCSFATSRSLPKRDTRLERYCADWNDAIGVADILSIRVSSSAQALLLCRNRVSVFS